MTLEKQIVNVDLGRGIDSKRDETTIQGSLVLLQNGEFDKVGAINKRLPFELLSATATTPDSLLPAATKLLSFKKSLNVITDRQTYAVNPSRVDAPNEIFYYDQQRDNYDRYEAAQSAIIQSFPIAGDLNTGLYATLDSISKDNLTYHLIRSTRISNPATFLYVTNSLDESLSYVLEVSNTATATYCGRFALLGNDLFVFYNSVADQNIRYKTLNTNNMVSPTLSAATILVADIHATIANRIFDVVTNNTNTLFFLVYNSATANTTKLLSHNGSATVNTAAIADNSDQAISIAYDSSVGPFLLVTYANALNEVRSENFSTVLVSTGTNFLISAEAFAVRSLSINGNQASFSSNGWPVLWSRLTATGLLNDTLSRCALISSTAVLDSARDWCRSIGINSKIFFFNSRHYVFGFYYSELQSTMFLLQISGFGSSYKNNVVGRFFSEQARPCGSPLCVPNVGVVGNTIRHAVANNKFFKPLSYIPRYGDGMFEVVVYLTDHRNFSSIEAANNSHVIGSMLSMYDGISCYEHNYNHYPEQPTLTQSVGGGLTLLGTYQYTVVFQWSDQFGQLHQSAPSIPASITLTGGNNRVTITLPCYRITNRKSTSYPVVAKIFRTTNLGTTFQEVGASNPTYTLDVSAGYQDDLADSALSSNSFIYTTGGVLENIAALPSWAVVNWKKRVCLMTERGVQFSKKIIDGVPVEFSDAFLIPLDTIGDRGTALAVMDDKLIIFKKDRIYYITGEGPNSTGTVGQFSDPIPIVSDVGCINPKSVVVTDKGVIFQGSTGFSMLLRNLSVAYIGSNVEYFTNNSPVITSSLLVEAKSQVRFLTESGECLVYDYLIEQWSVFTNHAGQDLALFNNKTVRINSSRNVVIETSGVTFVDYNNTEYTLKMRTSWLSFAELQGFMRVYRLLLYGKFKSHHILQVKVAYDYNPKVIDTYSFNTNGAGKSLSVIPDGAIYGDTVFSGNDIYQMRAHLSRQKCEAIQLTIEDTSLSGTKESYSLTNLAFEVGVKAPVFKKPAAFSNV